MPLVASETARCLNAGISTLHTRYPVENLAEAFAEGFTTGHPSMPEFQLDAAQINDLIAYLKSVQH